jgi:hypothetical protein
LGDDPVFAAPGPFVEGVQRRLAQLGRASAVDLLQRGRDRLAVLVGDVVQRGAYEVDDVRKYGLNLTDGAAVVGV